LPGGLPNLHLAVVSSSLGAGAFGNVPGCAPGSTGSLNGSFQHSAACTALHGSFISNTPAPNYDGDITDVFSCIANLGQNGCGFEHQFEATRLALMRAQNPADPDNAGFLRRDAYLGVIMLTNEDDCSVDASSRLFDPAQQTLADPLGGLQSYRCNEFGHLCGGVKPPHVPPAMSQTLQNCVSAEDGVLVTVAGFVTYLKSLKDDPDKILVSAIAGPTTPYTVVPRTFTIPATGSTEVQPQIAHSCMQSAGEYADPGVRVKQWLDAFGSNAVLESICAPDFTGAMVRIAQVLGRKLTVECVPSNIAITAVGTPDCSVTQTVVGGTGGASTIPFCGPGRPVVPCWEVPTSVSCSPRLQFQLCYDANCANATVPSTPVDISISCSLGP
jgi:hypothetical protein